LAETTVAAEAEVVTRQETVVGAEDGAGAVGAVTVAPSDQRA
jgi:hypothetical protein